MDKELEQLYKDKTYTLTNGMIDEWGKPYKEDCVNYKEERDANAYRPYCVLFGESLPCTKCEKYTIQ